MINSSHSPRNYSVPMLHSALPTDLATVALSPRKQLYFTDLRPTQPTCEVAEYKDLNSFLVGTGRKGIINEATFQFDPAQVRGIQLVDQTNKPVILASPTGSGKTFVGACIAAKYLADPHKKVLFVTPQVKLVKQIKGDCLKVLLINDEEITTTSGVKNRETRKLEIEKKRSGLIISTPHVAVYDAGIDSPKGRAKRVPLQKFMDLSSFDCVIVDEAHNARGDHPMAKFLKHFKDHQTKAKLILLSATPGENDLELDKLIELIGQPDEVDLIRLNISPKPKKFIVHKHIVPLSLLEPARPLEDAILNCHQRIVNALSEFPDLEKEARGILRRCENYIITAREDQTTAFAAKIRECIPNDTDHKWRGNLIDHVYTFGALGRYYSYLISTGRFFFLDRVGKEIATANLVKMRDDDGEVKSAMFVDPKERQNWFYIMLYTNRDLAPYRIQLDQTFRNFAAGTKYEAVLKATNIISLARMVPGIDEADLTSLMSTESPAGKVRYRTVNSLIDHIFECLRLDLSKKSGWIDHPFKDEILNIVSKHNLQERVGSIIIAARYYDDACFIADLLRTKLSQLDLEAKSVGGAKYMSHSDAEIVIEEFGRNLFGVLVGTSFIGEGHHIKGASTLIMTHPPSRGDEFQQFVGRVGRDGTGWIHVLTLPHTGISHLANRAKVARIEKLLVRRFRS